VVSIVDQSGCHHCNTSSLMAMHLQKVRHALAVFTADVVMSLVAGVAHGCSPDDLSWIVMMHLWSG
jgi:hypothetical protein